MTNAELEAVGLASAAEVLGVLEPAAAAAEAAAAREGGGPAAVAFSAVAARSALVSARLAAALSSAAMRRVTESLVVGGGGGGGVGDGDEEAVAAGLVGNGGDHGVLVALAPMLEELTDRQRRDYGLQVRRASRVVFFSSEIDRQH